MRSALVRLAAIVALIAGALTLGTAASAADGNSAAAHACQQGGYATYTRADGTTFANQDQCVSYAARGGQLVPKPSLTVTSRVVNGVALETYTGAGLLPGSPVISSRIDTSGDTFQQTIGTVGADGTFSLVDAATTCNFIVSSSVRATTASGGTITANDTPPC